MPSLSHFLENTKPKHDELVMEPPVQRSFSSTTIPQSPRSISSVSASPAASLFSTRTHSRFPSSVSSLASSPGMMGSTEAFGTMKTQLEEVKEEPQEPDYSLVEEDHYFRKWKHCITPRSTDCLTCILFSQPILTISMPSTTSKPRCLCP